MLAPFFIKKKCNKKNENVDVNNASAADNSL